MQLLGLVAFLAPGALSCLYDAVPVAQRRNLTNAEGETYPVGMWAGNWASGRLTSAMMQILIEEIMGFNVRTDESSGGAHQMFAITGCQQPKNSQDPGCGPNGPKKTYWHVGIECWVEGRSAVWSQIQRDFPATAPVSLGSVGYKGVGGQYILAATVDKALEDPAGLSLEYYGNYNASRLNPSQYFDSISAVNTSDLVPCTEMSIAPFFQPFLMETYLNATGDADGVEMVNGSLQGKCFSEYFWFPPACRVDTSRCLLFLTSFGYEFDVMMQRATAFKMPVAIADVKEWDTYQLLATRIRSLFYWWEPDPTFLGQNAKLILYPPFDRSSWERGIRTSAAADLSIENIVSHDLESLAPMVRELVDGFSLSMGVLKQLLLDQKLRENSAMDAACTWLQENRDMWEKWLPDTTKCFPQFGLFNRVTGTFQEDRRDASNLECKACGSGSFSATLRDNRGLTYVCRACSPGYAQPSGASSECQPCSKGEYQQELGASSCLRCAIGTYQDITGQSQCKRCPADRTTLGLGSQSLAECVCIAKLIEVDGQCIPCPEGTFCPIGSTLGALLTPTLPSANSSDVGIPQPSIKPGYTSNPADPLTTYKCRDHCPGGPPGTCADDRIGITCAECSPGSFSNDGRCVPCGGGNRRLGLICVGVLLLAGIFPAYYAVTRPYDAKTQVFGVVTSLLGLFLNLWQNLVVVSAAPTTWPALMVGMTEALGFMSFNFEMLGLSCVTSGGAVSKYFSQAVVFPVGIGTLLLTFALSKTLPRPSRCNCACLCIPPEVFQWTWYGTLCLIGKFFHVTFPTMTYVGLTPMMCYDHPGGKVMSIVKYSNTICWTHDHVVMGVAGIVLLTFAAGFLGLSMWASWMAPRFSSKGQAAAKFLFEDFRPEMAWYGVVPLFRGLCLSLPSVFVPNRPHVQMVLLHSTMMLSLVFQGYCQPWKAPALNLVDVASQSLFLTLLGVGLAGLEPNDDATAVFEVLGAVVCVCLILVCGLSISVFLLALALDKFARRGQMGRKCANIGDAPDPEVLVFLLQNLASSVKKNKSHKDLMVASMDRLGVHDARMIIMALTILEMEIGLQATVGSVALSSEDAAMVSKLRKFSEPSRIGAAAAAGAASAVSRRGSTRAAAARWSALRGDSDILKEAGDDDFAVSTAVPGSTGPPDPPVFEEHEVKNVEEDHVHQAYSGEEEVVSIYA